MHLQFNIGIRRCKMNTFFSKDNDRKHTSKSTKQWMEEKGILENVMVTPASSPDLNPIENIWSAMKTYLRSVVKPKKKDDLVKGIHAFWKTLTAETCAKYIDHVHRVIPDVILIMVDQHSFERLALRKNHGCANGPFP